MDYYKIGQNIRRYRKMNNLSQEQLAEKVNISTTHMSHIETGNTKLSLQVLYDLANVLGVSTDELLGRNDILDKDLFLNQVATIISQCDEQEMKVIIDIVRCTKEAIKTHLK